MVVFKRLPEPMDEMAKLVEVELVVVELIPVKFWRVEEPRATRFVVVAVLVIVRPPGKM